MKLTKAFRNHCRNREYRSDNASAVLKYGTELGHTNRNDDKKSNQKNSTESYREFREQTPELYPDKSDELNSDVFASTSTLLDIL